MAEQAASAKPVVVARAIASGLAVALLAGSTPFGLLFKLNARWHPEVPWLALGELGFVALFLGWLNGWGPPRRTAAARRYHLRLWRPGQRRDGSVWAIAAMIVALNAFYILAATSGGPRAPPDLGDYPTTAMRFSAFIMGALLSGVGEEAGFRGVMQSQLERFGPAFAIGVTSAVFALAHVTHGLAALPMLPGYFIVSVLYGVLAWRSGSILPSLVLHVLGDLADAWFIILGGNGGLLFA